MTFHIRPALPTEKAQLDELIRVSARSLSADVYSELEIKTALEHVFGVDSELVGDGTYFVAEDRTNGALLACGGWSRRRTLFGSDAFLGRESGLLDPVTDAAKIRAFFVHPEHARRGIGRALLAYCEEAARSHGFSRAELMATLPGVPLYRACGYVAGEETLFAAPNGATVRFVPMAKALKP